MGSSTSVAQSATAKPSWRIIPLLGLGYLCSYLDRLNVSFAATQMNVDLNEWGIPDAAEAMNLSRLDHENIAGAGFELLSVDVPEASALPHNLHFVVRVTVGPRSSARESAQEKH